MNIADMEAYDAWRAERPDFDVDFDPADFVSMPSLTHTCADPACAVCTPPF